MNAMLLDRNDTSAGVWARTAPSRRTPCLEPQPANCLRRAEDREYLAMEDAYARNGGLACGDEVARMLRHRSSQPLSQLARWITDRVVISFPWQSRLLVPLFQFERIEMRLRPATVEVVCELVDTLDDWDLAFWFAHPNSWLDDRLPVEVIETDAAAVLQAARADRYVSRW